MRLFKTCAALCLLAGLSGPLAADVFVEDFSDPLGAWTSDWLYLNSNLENIYVAEGDCDPDNRGNNPGGLWVSDDRGCGTQVGGDPVVINFLNGFGDAATAFSLDVCSFTPATLSIFDKNGSLQESVPIPGDCDFSFPYVNYAFTLPAGISRFEFSGGNIEGNTSIDNVTIDTTPAAPTAAKATFRVTKDFSDNNPMAVEVTLRCNTGLPLVQSAEIVEGVPEVCELDHGGAAAVDAGPHTHAFTEVNFVVTSFEEGAMDCSITESPVPDGYTVEYLDGTPSPLDCSFADVTSGSRDCTVVNTLEALNYEVVKQWVYEGDDPSQAAKEAVVDLECENARSSATGSLIEINQELTLTEGSPVRDVVLYPNFGEPATACRAIERVSTSGVESDQGCADWAIMEVGGADVSCTITNTLFFEGVPVLGRGGLALLVLLTLGVGLVAMRRIV